MHRPYGKLIIHQIRSNYSFYTSVGVKRYLGLNIPKKRLKPGVKYSMSSKGSMMSMLVQNSSKIGENWKKKLDTGMTIYLKMFHPFLAFVCYRKIFERPGCARFLQGFEVFHAFLQLLINAWEILKPIKIVHLQVFLLFSSL